MNLLGPLSQTPLSLEHLNQGGASIYSANLRPESCHPKDLELIKLIDAWEKDAPDGEDRRAVAVKIKNAAARNVTELEINNSSITKIPPLPRSVTWLTLSECKYLENLDVDLSQLSELSIFSCGIKTLPVSAVNLIMLEVINCNFVGKVLVDYSKLTSFRLSKCAFITELSSNLPLLEVAQIRYCVALEKWSGELPSINKATIADCDNLTTWSCSVPKLAELTSYGNPKLTEFPDDLPLDLVVNGKISKEALYFPQMVRAQNDVQTGLPKLSPVQIDKAHQDTVTQSYKQQYRRSCGAASLFFIAKDLSFKKFPILAETLKKFPVLRDTFPLYDENLPMQFFTERDVYKITSAFEGDIANIDQARGSLPHNIIVAATMLGLEATFYAEALEFNELFNGIAINTQKPPLGSDELEMKLISFVDSTGKGIVGEWDEVFHWVVSRPDGSIMDPAAGGNYKNLEELASAYGKKKLFIVDSGVAIVLNCSRSVSSSNESSHTSI